MTERLHFHTDSYCCTAETNTILYNYPPNEKLKTVPHSNETYIQSSCYRSFCVLSTQVTVDQLTYTRLGVAEKWARQSRQLREIRHSASSTLLRLNQMDFQEGRNSERKKEIPQAGEERSGQNLRTWNTEGRPFLLLLYQPGT